MVDIGKYIWIEDDQYGWLPGKLYKDIYLLYSTQLK